MKFNPDIKHIYMLGIGGIGMSALARYFHAMGHHVSGYDRTATPLTKKLQEEGMAIHYDDDPGKIPARVDLVIYTPAIPRELKELHYFTGKEIPLKKRAEILGELTLNHKTIAVAGTHGKTTVSTMIAHILYASKQGCSAFLGGISKNHNSNFLHTPESEWMVVEADEFDRSFLQLKPAISVVTSMDADHLDIYSSYENLKDTFGAFIAGTQAGGTVLLKNGVDVALKDAKISLKRYALEGPAGFYAETITNRHGQYHFTLVTPTEKIKNLTMQMPGMINLENAVAAASAALLAGVSADELRQALTGFTGIKRRFDVRVKTGDTVYIDDYAHHPEEITGLVTSVRKLYPGKKILGIFQPHLFSRTRDFATGFAQSLGLLDEVVLLPIYPAREKPLPGVDANLILEKIDNPRKQLIEKADLLDYEGLDTNDVILTIGAGDIDQLVEPLENELLNRIKA